MSAPQPNSFFLDRVLSARQPDDILIDFAGHFTRVSHLAEYASIADRALYAGQNILVKTEEPYNTALALIELDGVAARIVICPPNLPHDHYTALITAAEIDAVIIGTNAVATTSVSSSIPCVESKGLIYPRQLTEITPCPTEWVLLTSGTTGVPKMVSHSFATLTVNIRRPETAGVPIIWASFNDMRRFSGLQMFLHALLTDSRLVLKPVEMAVADFLPVLETSGATHVSGTPTHWRKVLMFSGRKKLKLEQITLVGEIAEQSLLDALRDAYPNARVTHIYGSTEAGTGFSVHDGKAGFPADWVGRNLKGLELKVNGDMLLMKSNRSARNYVGNQQADLMDGDGFIETGDQVERTGDRYHFLGRKSGAVNIGGSRVHPEEVEAALNADPRVSMAAVFARKNPFTGAILVADVVRHPTLQVNESNESLARQLMASLRNSLEAYKVPASIRIVGELRTSDAGKLERRGG